MEVRSADRGRLPQVGTRLGFEGSGEVGFGAGFLVTVVAELASLGLCFSGSAPSSCPEGVGLWVWFACGVSSGSFLAVTN